MSEIIDSKGLTEGGFTINFKLINQYHQKDPRLQTKEEMSHINLNLITCYDKIVILSRFQSYILHW